jgi:hypothetical protein
MVIGKIKPTATLVAQYPANCEVDAIEHDGRLFLPVVSLGAFTPTKEEDPKPAKKSAPTFEEATREPAAVSPALAVSEAEVSEDDTQDELPVYAERDLMEMPTKELLAICEKLGIDPDAQEGKNTNKKLRLLILDAQEGMKPAPKTTSKSVSKADDDTDDLPFEDSMPKSAKTKDFTHDVAKVLEAFDNGDMNEKKSLATIKGYAPSDDYDEEGVEKAFREFADNSEADIMDIAQQISDALNSQSGEEVAEVGSKEEPAGELVEPSQLHVGDRVSVYWADEANKCWYSGEVSAMRRGKPTIKYDDGTESMLGEHNTKIMLIEE